MNRCSLSAPEQSSTELERAVLRTKLNYAKSSFWGFLSKKNGIDAISNKMYTNFKSHCPVVVMLIECHHFFYLLNLFLVVLQQYWPQGFWSADSATVPCSYRRKIRVEHVRAGVWVISEESSHRQRRYGQICGVHVEIWYFVSICNLLLL